MLRTQMIRACCGNPRDSDPIADPRGDGGTLLMAEINELQQLSLKTTISSIITYHPYHIYTRTNAYTVIIHINRRIIYNSIRYTNAQNNKSW
jgi:hypothetical protein